MENLITILSFYKILGQDIQFWLTVLVGVTIKWLISTTRQTFRQSMTGIVAGAAAAYYGHEWVLRNFTSLTMEDKEIVVIGLVLAGEHIVRGFMSFVPSLVEAKAKLGTAQKDQAK